MKNIIPININKNILNQTIAYLSNNELVMVSLMAKSNCVTFWEKLLIPSFIYFFQKIYPFSKVNNPKNALAAAAGGFVLCKAKLFDNKNLFEVIKNKKTNIALWYEDHVVNYGPNWQTNLQLIEKNHELIDKYFNLLAILFFILLIGFILIIKFL